MQISLHVSSQAYLIITSMSCFILLLFILLCLSLHACTARPLIATHKETQKYQFHKGIDRMKLLETTLSGSRLKQAAKQQKVANGSASNSKQVVLVTTSGTEVATSYFQKDLLIFFKTKELRRHARSLLGPAHGHGHGHGHVERVVDPKGGDSVEDIVEMDYAQPRKKPPIHNENEKP